MFWCFYMSVTRKVQTLDNDLWDYRWSRDGFLDNVEGMSTYFDQIKSIQYKDRKLGKICDKVFNAWMFLGVYWLRRSIPFHVLKLKKCHEDGDYIICQDSMLLHEDLSYGEKSIAILDRDVWEWRNKVILSTSRVIVLLRRLLGD